MDWSNERYVRLYVRVTSDESFWPWQARLVWPQLIRRADRSGVIDCGKRSPAQVVAKMLDIPEDVASAAVASLIEDTCLLHNGSQLVIRNHIEAQEAVSSDAQRQRESRAKRAAGKPQEPGDGGSREATNTEQPVTIRDTKSRAVTPGHAPSQSVTPSVPSVPSVPNQKKNGDCEGGAALPRRPAPSQPAIVLGEPRKRRPNAPLKDPLEHQITTSATWDAYRVAYFQRYGAEPTRNAKVNGQVSHFMQRVPHDEAPAIAAHYLTSNNSRYVAAGHAWGPLVQDAEKLRTEYLTGRSGTAHAAQQADKRAGRGEQYRDLIAKLEAEEKEAAQ